MIARRVQLERFVIKMGRATRKTANLAHATSDRAAIQAVPAVATIHPEGAPRFIVQGIRKLENS